MKFFKICLPLLAVCICSCSTLKLKKDYSNKPVYVYGISASFTDTIVYYTDVQMVDSVRLEKNGLLPYRDIYSYQLKSYLEDTKGLQNRTCMTYFSINKSRLEKEQTKVLNRYKKDNSVVEKINPGEFSYKKPE